MRRLFVVLATLALVVASAPAAGLSPAQSLELAKLDLDLIALVLGRSAELEKDPAAEKLRSAFEGVHAVSEVASFVGPVLALRLPIKDPWGRPYRIAATRQHLAILSFGPDGAPDLEYGANTAAILGRLLDGSASTRDDVVSINGQWQDFAPKILASKLAMAMLLSLGTAVESYAVDNDAYPSSEGRLVLIDAVLPMLEPVHIRTAPRTDPWGFPIFYLADAQRYLIVSPGADGTPDQPYTLEGFFLGEGKYNSRGPTTRPEDDILFCEGTFAQWPRSADDPIEP